MPKKTDLKERETLRQRAEELSRLAKGVGQHDELETIKQQLRGLEKEILSGLTSIDRVRLARHPKRPYTLDFISTLCEDFVELHGDRRFGDDTALICGLAKFDGESVAVIGHQKGKDTRQNLFRNFGMAKPEGYRKAMRVMKLAEKFDIPVLTFIDTTGAFPGIEGEERGQAEAIAYNLREMARLRVPIIVNVTGEGGSGGALAIGVGDVINMMENAVYSVISPEGCASILWRDHAEAPKAAAAMKVTAVDLKHFGIVDEIVPEPEGGAHNDPELAARSLGDYIRKALKTCKNLSAEKRIERRYQKFRKMGEFTEGKLAVKQTTA